MAKTPSELIGQADQEAERALRMFRKYKRLADRWWDRYEAETKKRDRYAKADAARVAAEGDGSSIQERLRDVRTQGGVKDHKDTWDEYSASHDRVIRRKR